MIFFLSCFYALLHVNNRSNFHWVKFWVYFFNLFHLKKTEFTLETLTHASICKVLACVSLKPRRLCFPCAGLGLGFPSVWWEDTPQSRAMLHLGYIRLCPALRGLSVWWRFWLWKGCEGERETQRGINHSQTTWEKYQRINCQTTLLTADWILLFLSLPFLGANANCALRKAEGRVRRPNWDSPLALSLGHRPCFSSPFSMLQHRQWEEQSHRRGTHFTTIAVSR